MSNYDLDPQIIAEMWDAVKEEISEKGKVIVLKEMLLTLESHGVINEDDLKELRSYDRYMRNAVDIIYKEMDIEDEEDEWDE